MTMNKLSSSRLEGIHLQKSNLIQPGRAEAKEDAMHFPSDARATVVTLTMNRLSSCRRTSHFSKSDRPSSRSEPIGDKKFTNLAQLAGHARAVHVGNQSELAPHPTTKNLILIASGTLRVFGPPSLGSSPPVRNKHANCGKAIYRRIRRPCQPALGQAAELVRNERRL